MEQPASRNLWVYNQLALDLPVAGDEMDESAGAYFDVIRVRLHRQPAQ